MLTKKPSLVSHYTLALYKKMPEAPVPTAMPMAEAPKHRRCKANSETLKQLTHSKHCLILAEFNELFNMHSQNRHSVLRPVCTQQQPKI